MGGGKRLEVQAAEKRATRPPSFKEILERGTAKRKASFEKRKGYPGENIKDIREFEKFKEKRLERRFSKNPRTPGKIVGGQHSTKEYEKGRAFAERHKDKEAEFLKFVPDYPAKKERRKTRKPMRLDDALRHAMRSKRRAATRKAKRGEAA
jgi:hypothetical protein